MYLVNINARCARMQGGLALEEARSRPESQLSTVHHVVKVSE